MDKCRKLVLPCCHSLSASVPPPPQVSVCLCTQSLTTSCLSSPWRKRQLQFLLDGRGRRAGLSPEELRDNGKLLGEGLSRALFNYPSRDCSADSPEVGLGFLLQFIVLNSCQVASDTASSLESDLNVCLSPILTHICQPKANLASLIHQVTYLFPTIHQSLLLSVWTCYLFLYLFYIFYWVVFLSYPKCINSVHTQRNQTSVEGNSGFHLVSCDYNIQEKNIMSDRFSLAIVVVKQ